MSKKRTNSRKGKKLALEQRKAAENTSDKLSSFGELRSVGDDGTFEGYLTVWDTIDSYNSTFKRGSFANTIQNRGTKVKVFYDHEHLVGSSLELREDDHGVFGKGKLNLSVDKASEAFEFMKDGTLEGLSFSFRAIKDAYENGVRVIEELQLFEFGPVVFPANEHAIVTDVRSEDFNTSLTQEMLYAKNYRIRDALDVTLSDIWWSSDTTSENVVGKIDMALSGFHVAYLEFANEWIAEIWGETRCAPTDNELSNAFAAHLAEKRSSVQDLAADSSFTTAELTSLSRGQLIEARGKLSELPEMVKLAHQEQRSKALENLCSQLRDGLTPTEKRRIQALLTTPTEERGIDADEATSMLEYLTSFNQTLENTNA